jgi:hypothetical protein
LRLWFDQNTGPATLLELERLREMPRMIGPDLDEITVLNGPRNRRFNSSSDCCGNTVRIRDLLDETVRCADARRSVA